MSCLIKLTLTVFCLFLFTACSVAKLGSSVSSSSTSALDTIAWQYDDNETIKLSSK